MTCKYKYRIIVRGEAISDEAAVYQGVEDLMANRARHSKPLNTAYKGTQQPVSSEYAKAGADPGIPQNPNLVRIYEHLIASDRRPEYYTKHLKKVVRELSRNGHRFHDLRHTFGVRTWLQTGDIMLGLAVGYAEAQQSHGPQQSGDDHDLHEVSTLPFGGGLS